MGMTLTLVQLPAFIAAAKRLGLGDDDVRALENMLLANPAAGQTVAGTGGLRKVRFAPPSWNTGKRGATRVCYAYFSTAAHVFFFTVYAKNVQENLTAAEKAYYRRVLGDLARRM
jgi:hypothetical protein